MNDEMRRIDDELNQDSEASKLDFPIMEILIVIALVIILGMAGSLIAKTLAESNGSNLSNLLSSLHENNSFHQRNMVRYVNLIVHLMSFTIPCLLLAFYMRKKAWAQYLSLNSPPKSTIVFLSFWLILLSLPFINTIYWVNMQIPLPEWANTMEVNANEMINALLTMEGPSELLLNLVIIALVPALGEELLFRGVFQQTLYKIFRSKYTAIWVTAFLFSAMHLQFEGFIPRFLLGALLGYLFLWTKNLWIPIIAHFFFNGVQVAAKYFASDLIESTGAGEVADPNIGFGLLSLVLTIVLAKYIRQKAYESSVL